MTKLETRLYIALLGARVIVAATANINPRALRTKNLIDSALAAYKAQERPEKAEETVHADGD